MLVGGLSDDTVVGSDLPPGATVSRHGLSLHVPRPGYGVWAEVVLADGGAVELSVQTGRDGKVTVRDSSTTPGLQLWATAVTNPCSDGGYATYGVRWATTVSWRFLASSTPSGVSQSSAASAFRSAANRITGAYNDCGLADSVSATNAYLGTISTAIGVTNTGSCATSDKNNVVGFGSLPSGYLGMTCFRTMSSTVFEADMKLNKAYYHWYTSKPSPCSARWSVTAAATHEFGHLFGLGHVSETYHPSLTMSPIIRACQSSEATLGLGDVRGLNSLY